MPMLLFMFHSHLSDHVLFLFQPSHARTEAVLTEHTVNARLFDDVLIALFELFVIRVVLGDLAELLAPVVGLLAL